MTTDDESRFREGKAAFHSGDLQLAIDSFYAVVEVNDQHHLAWNALGVVYSQANAHESADICFKNALTLMPDNPVYLQNRGRNNKKIKALWEKHEIQKKPEKIPHIRIIMVFLGVGFFISVISLALLFR